MSPEFLTEVEAAYNEVVRLQPAARREFLSDTYGHRPDVVHEVESLLEHQGEADRFDRSILVAAATEMLQDADNVIGSVIGGRYVIRQCIGRGATAEVYLAEHIALQSAFALKRPLPALRSDPDYRKRFLEEARRAVLLKHDNVAHVHDVINEGPDIFVVMEHVEGETLRTRLNKMGRPFTVSEFLPIAMQCASALAAAHEKRIVHLDVKPENIMLTPAGKVKICDFGVARRLSPDNSNDTTATSDPHWTFAGTPAYMAPEVILSQNFDERADLFSIGTVFYEMLTGRNPFLADTLMATTARVVSDDPPPISSVNSNINHHLESVVARLLTKDPQKRCATASDLVQDLRAVRRSYQRFSDIARSVREAFNESSRIKVAVGLVLLSLAALLAWNNTSLRYKTLKADRSIDAKLNTHRVLIADFENHTNDPYFDRTFRELLTIGLGQSRVLNIFPRDRAIESLRQMQRTPLPERIDQVTAKTICLKENVDTLVSGDITLAGTGFQIVARAVDPRTDDVKKVITQTVLTKADLTRSISAIATQLRTNLGEQPTAIAATSKPLEQVTTGSALALARYFEALDLQRTAKLTEARALLESVVQLDPEFAMAHDHLASLYRNDGNGERALEEISHAYELRDRLSEREQYLISARYHFERAEYEESVEDYRRATLLFPSDAYAHKYLAQSLNIAVRLNEAVDSMRRAAELDPADATVAGLRALFLAQANRPDDALVAIQEARIKFPSVTYLAFVEGFVWMLKGDFPHARSLFAEFNQGGGSSRPTQVSVAQTYMLEGEPSLAIRELETKQAERQNYSQSAFDTMSLSFLAKLYLQHGMKQDALRIARVLMNVKPSPLTLVWLREAGLIFVDAGDRPDAQAVLEKIEGVRAEFPSAYTRGVNAQIKGEVARLAGNSELARQSFEEAGTNWLDPSTCWSAARFYFDRKEYRQARNFLKAMQALKGDVLRWHFGWTLPMSQLLIARCERNLGNNAEADKSYTAFLQFWGRSKEMASLVNEVRREQSTLLFKQ